VAAGERVEKSPEGLVVSQLAVKRTSGFGMLMVAFSHLHAAVLQKPVREEVAYVDHAPAPRTVPEMVSAAAAVVVAEYTGRSRLIEENAAHPIMTSYTFRLVETVKRHGALPLDGDEMEVELHGGDKEHATYIERTRVAETRALKKNHTYVLFFAWNLIQNKLQLAWGPSLYDVAEGYVRSVDVLTLEHDGKTAAAFLAELRTAQK
jgi:hypothetical protein